MTINSKPYPSIARRFALAPLLSAMVLGSGCLAMNESGPGGNTAATSSGGNSESGSTSTSSGTKSESGSTSTPSAGGGSTSSAPKDSSGSAPSFLVALRADSNRDGRVDMTGNSDVPDKLTASRAKGALFLANLDDDSGRCNYEAHEASESCYDAADEVVNGPEDAKDLAIVKSLPMRVSDSAVGTFTLSEGASKRVRVFVQSSPGEYKALPHNAKVSAEQLRSGLTLGVEGKDIARDLKQWDGKIQLHIEVVDGRQRGKDSVALRVAPILTHSHRDHVEKLVASPVQGPLLDRFRSDLEKATQAARVGKPLLLKAGGVDEWAQDYFEPFYASIPGPKGPQTMRVLLRSDQERAPAQLDLYTIAGRDVAVAAIRLVKSEDENPPGRDLTYNSFGNLETMPPMPGFPAGRQVVGGSADKRIGPSEAMMKLLYAQGVQDPIYLDVTWLAVGHVDEFISFVPSPDAKLGFKVLVADPAGGLALLEKAIKEGHGKTPMISYVPQSAAEKAAFKEAQLHNPTIAAFVADKEIQDMQAYAERKIAENLVILRNAIGVTDEDIVRIPNFYWEGAAEPMGGSKGGGKSGARGSLRSSLGLAQYLAAFSPEQREIERARLASRQDDPNSERPPMTGSYLPAAMNMVVLPKNKFILMATQFGPRINGEDIIQSAVTKRIAEIGYSARYVDDFLTYHTGSGDLHCGTNTLRVPLTKWWAP